MEAQAWTAIGLLAATLLSTLFYLGNKIDFLANRFDGRLDALESKLGARIDHLESRVEDQGRALSSQMYDLAARLEDHLRWHAG